MAFQLQAANSAVRLPARARAGVSAVSSRSAAPPAQQFVAPGLLSAAPALRVQRTLQRQEQTAKHVVAATEANFDEGIGGSNDYHPILAVAAFVAVRLNKLHVDRVKVLQALAILQLFVTVVNLVSRKTVGDKVTAFIGPAVLASAVLSIRHVTYIDTATALFGYFLSENLEGITGIPVYAFLATLAVALYLGYGTLWYVVAFGVAAAGKVYASTKDSSPVPIIVLPAIAASAYAIWKEATFPLALSIYLAQTVWSAFGAVDSLSKSIQK